MISIQKNAINSTPIFTKSLVILKNSKLFKTKLKLIKKYKIRYCKLGFTNELLEQLININQQKLNLLKMLQTEINKTNIRFIQNRNHLDTEKVYYIQI
jgi:hypothetical protein